ncbi:MAG: DUF2459 domain-containing protein [Alteraurantiacibacter sp. bin_em_oilr2.035]|nr:DUF2459 domain-containing protein [Aurantiacibacter atlanticus]MDF1834764.1 DUF2459 domain-containing protein [Alteraurantiacibacter sp. bin_em_oilr2.035]
MMRKLIRITLAIFAVLAVVMTGYILAAWVGSSIPQNSDWTEPAEGVDIMIETNGTHTSIIVPVVTEVKDWRTTFPSAAKSITGYGERAELPTHLAIGFGEREVFLHVPTWGDLSATTALRIATIGGDAVMRVAHYVRPAAGKDYRPLRISRRQYAALVQAIERDLPPITAGAKRGEFYGTYANDAYYEARSGYSMVNTCNSWVGSRLADAGITMGWWTPLAGGVMKWIPVRTSDQAP